MEKKINLRVRLPVETINKISEIAKDKGLSISKLVEEILKLYLDK